MEVSIFGVTIFQNVGHQQLQKILIILWNIRQKSRGGAGRFGRCLVISAPGVCLTFGRRDPFRLVLTDIGC